MSRAPMAHCICQVCTADHDANLLLFVLAAICVFIGGYLR